MYVEVDEWSRSRSRALESWKSGRFESIPAVYNGSWQLTTYF